MKNIFLIAISSLFMCSCGYEIVKKKPAPKPKLTKEQIRKQQYEEKLITRYRCVSLNDIDHGSF